MSASAYMMQEELPKIATLFERTLASQVEHILALENPIADLWNPDKCPSEILPYLAWALSVDVWDDDWPEEKQRYVIERSFSDHKIKGTLECHRRYIDYAGAKLVGAVTAPQAFFLSSGEDDPAYQRWMNRLPELRIKTKTESGIATNFVVIGGEDDGFPSEGFLGASNDDPTDQDSDHTATWFIGGEITLDDRLEASYIKNGVEAPVNVSIVPDTRKGKHGDVRVVSFPGEAGRAWFCNDVESIDGFLGGTIDGPTVNLKFLDGDPSGENWNVFSRDNEKIQDVAPNRISLGHDYAFKTFCNTPFEGSFLNAEDPEENFYYSLRIFDGSLKSPATSFLDFDRFGMKPFTAELKVEIFEPAVKNGFYTGTYANDAFALPEPDFSKLWAATDASVSAKSLTDTIYFDLDISSNKTFSRIRSMGNLEF